MNNTRSSSKKEVPQIVIKECDIIDTATKQYMEDILKNLESKSTGEVDRYRLNVTLDTKLIELVRIIGNKYHANLSDIIDEAFRLVLKKPELFKDVFFRKEDDYITNKRKRTPKNPRKKTKYKQNFSQKYVEI
ncbi:MAG: hypothetical protein ACM3O3_12705 [Syntrophothermus sp.]